MRRGLKSLQRKAIAPPAAMPAAGGDGDGAGDGSAEEDDESTMLGEAVCAECETSGVLDTCDG